MYFLEPSSFQKRFYIHKFIVKSFFCIDHIITTRNVFDSIVENVLICNTNEYV